VELLDHLLLGLQTAASLSNLFYCFIGVFLGTAIGVLPGLGPTATIAMLLPVTFVLPPVTALIMLAGIYYGSQYGGSTTSILVNIPGEATSVVTCLDGHQMARQGRAGTALAIAAIGSFFAGCVATVLVAALGAPLTSIALLFGPAEYFSLMVLALTTVSALFGRVDPYASAVVRISAGEETSTNQPSSHDLSVKLDEANVTLLTLPFGTTARFGLMRPRFGTLNTIHQDDLPQVDRPNVLTQFFGPEEIDGESGLEAFWVLPLPNYNELSLGIFNGDNEVAFGNGSLRDPLVMGRWRTFFEFDEAGGLQLDFSAASGVTSDNQRGSPGIPPAARR
jgi:hypothetical protein